MLEGNVGDVSKNIIRDKLGRARETAQRVSQQMDQRIEKINGINPEVLDPAVFGPQPERPSPSDNITATRKLAADAVKRTGDIKRNMRNKSLPN